MVTMDVAGFIRGAAEVLDVDAQTLSLETEFRTAVPHWSSLLGYGLIVWMEETYGFDCPIGEFQRAKRLRDLFDMAGKHE
jgi:hypothetical protein